MKNEHIIRLIESKPLAGMNEDELATVRAHAVVCSSCNRAFEAAQISALLLKERAGETFAPPPFFQARVLAALRERQAASEQWSWSRIWRATGALASSMVATVATIAVLTFVIPGTQTNSELSSVSNAYSAEDVILNAGDLPDNQPSDNQIDQQVSDGQVLATLDEADQDR